MQKTRTSILMILSTLLVSTTLLLLPYTPKPVVQTVLVEMGDLLRSVHMSGTVNYARDLPAMALRSGQIRAVHVQNGERVAKGELLFSFDTSFQERALAKLNMVRYNRQKALSSVGDAVSVLALSEELELTSAETEIRAQIESSQIRAQMDGIIESVYVQAGEWVETGNLLGRVRGEEKCVLSAIRTQDIGHIETGMAAVVKDETITITAAELQKLTAPETTASGLLQQAVFVPLEKDGLHECEVGQRVVVEVLSDALEDVALIPLAAVSHDNEVWVVRQGRAEPISIDLSAHNEAFVAADREWTGETIILFPDEYALTSGCRVEEARP